MKNLTAREQNRRAAEVRVLLSQRFPLAFFGRGLPKLPLKVGICDDILLELPEIAARDLRLALADYTSGPTYLSMVTAGAARIGINGETDGHVTSAEAVHAATRLGRFEGWLKSRATQAETAGKGIAA